MYQSSYLESIHHPQSDPPPPTQSRASPSHPLDHDRHRSLYHQPSALHDHGGSSSFYGQQHPPPHPSSSLPNSSFLQRSTSSLSLYHHLDQAAAQPVFGHHNPRDHHHLFDFRGGSMRRVYSTGDILEPGGGDQNSSTTQEDGAGAAAHASSASVSRSVGRYNAEERRERIERYRSKRNQRNFQKKITYACRKTLADSRPRVRGRFARNGEPEFSEADGAESGEGSAASHNMNGCGDGVVGGYCQWGEYSGSTSLAAGGVAASAEEEEDYSYDSEMWTNFLDVFSMNNMIS